MTDRPHLVYLAVSASRGPTTRYRILQYREAFERAGIDLTILHAFGDGYFAADEHEGAGRRARRLLEGSRALARRLAQVPAALGAGGLVIEREAFPYLPPIIERLVTGFGPGYVLELDDAVYLSRGRRYKYPGLLRGARAVIVGNAHLAEFARRYNRDVNIVPTTVDVTKYSTKTSYRLSSSPRLGWVGLPCNFPHLAAIAPALKVTCQEHRARLVVVSARPPVLDLPLEFVPWSEATEAESIRSFDVGIMPLADTPFARGKAGLKVLQYMAAAAPTVASPVGVNEAIIRSGENGLLARTADEWSAALDALLASEALRERLGRAGRRTVEADYACATWGEELVRLYRRIFDW
jgi:glycosyltransferase involved in cell wall biosynthesis